MPTPRRWPIALPTLVAIAAAALAYATMRGGIGLLNDSQAYLRMADGIALRAGGDAVTDTLSRRFPPAFPALLALGEACSHVGLQRVARLMNVACMIASTLLVAALARRARPGDASPDDAWRAALAGVLYATASDSLNVHTSLLSEPTFTCWMLLGALSLDRYLRDDGRRRWLIAVAALGAAAVLTRYAGVALVVAEAIVVLARSPRPRRATRVAHAAIVAIVPMLAMFAWTLGAPRPGLGVGQRELTVAIVALPRLDQALAAFGSWVAWYAPWPNVARAGGAVALAVFAWLIARPGRALANPALALPWTFLWVYPLFLLVSITFVDPATPLDLRILAPLHAMAIVVACATLGTRAPRRVVAAAAIALLAAQLASTAYYAANIRQAGLGYASARWRDNQAVRLAATLPPDAAIFTTHHFALELMLGRNVFELPAWPDAASPSDEAPRDDASLAALAAPMVATVGDAGGRGYLVYLRRPRPAKSFLTPGQLGRYLKLQRVADSADGRVFRISGVLSDVRPTTATAPADASRVEADAPATPDAD